MCGSVEDCHRARDARQDVTAVRTTQNDGALRTGRNILDPGTAELDSTETTPVSDVASMMELDGSGRV